MCLSWRTVYSVRSTGARVIVAWSLHTLQTAPGQEQRRGVECHGRSLHSSDLICYILEDSFSVNIFLRLKKGAIISSITSKTGTNQSVSSFLLKDDTHPKCILGPKGHIHERQWAKFTTPLIRYHVLIICKDYNSLDTTSSAK